MNAKTFIAAISAFIATESAFAQEYVQPDAGFFSTKSRATVVAEVIQARNAGTLQVVDSTYPVINVEPSRSREEVVAELIQAREDGTLDVSEHAYPVIQTSGTPKTREEVQAELAEYIASGQSQLPSNH